MVNGKVRRCLADRNIRTSWKLHKDHCHLVVLSSLKFSRDFHHSDPWFPRKLRNHGNLVLSSRRLQTKRILYDTFQLKSLIVCAARHIMVLGFLCSYYNRKQSRLASTIRPMRMRFIITNHIGDFHNVVQ
jgi:hypothetical protein